MFETGFYRGGISFLCLTAENGQEHAIKACSDIISFALLK